MFIHIVGARPNFMKLAPLYKELENAGIKQQVIHTGQHFDKDMSSIFFSELGLNEPDFNLGINTGSPVNQIASMMVAIEELLNKIKPNLVIVYGDVNSSLAGALTAYKLNIKVAHIEAGLRSFDRSMPEEGNRLIIDHLSDFLYSPSADGVENLIREGISKDKILMVGNIMIDSLSSIIKTIPMVKEEPFALVTLHRPSNVDEPKKLFQLLHELEKVSYKIRLKWPIHPRTKRQLETNGFTYTPGNIEFMAPLGYRDFLALQANSTFVITDSGGVQEETTFLGKPCLTLRNNTERPVTITEGTNYLLGENFDQLHKVVDQILSGESKQGSIPKFWDGQTAKRIVEHLSKKGLF